MQAIYLEGVVMNGHYKNQEIGLLCTFMFGGMVLLVTDWLTSRVEALTSAVQEVEPVAQVTTGELFLSSFFLFFALVTIPVLWSFLKRQRDREGKVER